MQISRERIKRLYICMTSINYPHLKKVIYNDREYKIFNINTQIKKPGTTVHLVQAHIDDLIIPSCPLLYTYEGRWSHSSLFPPRFSWSFFLKHFINLFIQVNQGKFSVPPFLVHKLSYAVFGSK